jgi:DNA-binding protein HU-beta
MKNQKIRFEQILNSVVEKNSISKTFARTLIHELTQLIQEGLLKDSVVNLAGFGIFRLHDVPERTGRNVQNGQSIVIPAHRKVLFKPEKHIRELINKKYEDLKAQVPDIGKVKANQPAEKKDDATETDVTLSAIAKSLDSMIKEEPKKREPEELSDEPLLKDDIMGVEEKEKLFAEKEDEKSRKKLYIGAGLVAILLILLLFMQFGGDENDAAEMAEKEKPAVETVITEKEKAPPAPVKNKENQSAVKLKTIISKKGDNLWNLAFEHYKDGYLWPLILQANKSHISNPDLIEPGESIKIPVIADPLKLTAAETKMLSDGHLTAYFEYKGSKNRDALNHLFVADKYDHENVKKSLAKIDNSDYQSIQNLSLK